MTAAQTKLDELARLLDPKPEQVHQLGNRISRICGFRGMAGAADDAVVLSLRLQLLNPDEMAIGRELVDAGVITAAEGDNNFRLLRQPSNDQEIVGLRRLLGVKRRWFGGRA